MGGARQIIACIQESSTIASLSTLTRPQRPFHCRRRAVPALSGSFGTLTPINWYLLSPADFLKPGECLVGIAVRALKKTKIGARPFSASRDFSKINRR